MNSLYQRNPPIMTTRIIYIPELAKRLGQKTSTIYTTLWEIRHGKRPINALPTPLDIPGRTRWTEIEYEDWINRNSKPAKPNAAPVIEKPPKPGDKPGRPRHTDPVEIKLY